MNNSGIILYNPLKDEVNCLDKNFPIRKYSKTLMLPSSKKENPFDWADKCKKYFGNKKISILVPGTKFDIFGTRYGRGFGWYDRFLSKVPSHWLRIGVTDKSKLSSIKLRKESWDQTMDFVITRDAKGWLICKTRT